MEDAAQKPLIEVAIEGDGLSPSDVPLRQLVELLEATAGVFDAVARDAGMETPVLRLVAVRNGSAAYDLFSDSPVAERFLEAAKARGKESSAAVRRALSRLHQAGTRLGSVRLARKTVDGPYEHAIHLAAPVEQDAFTFEHSLEIFGRVVGVLLREDGVVVRLRPSEGRVTEFKGTHELGAPAAAFFGKTVRVQAIDEVTGVTHEGRIVSIEPWNEDDVVAVLRSVRDELAAEEVYIDAEAWLRMESAC